MIIKSINISKFRGFNKVNFELGKNLTVIAGQNGTQKTTVLGMLTQPFSITDKSNPIQKEKPLSGGNFRSSFSDKFKLSEVFDTPKNHEWTIELFREQDKFFTIESIPRKIKGLETARFWKKGIRTKGSGYIQLPVIFLSLSRLFPIGEDGKIKKTKDITLSADEKAFFEKWHNKILLTPDASFTEIDYLSSTQKKTVGVTTTNYDWKMNSSGQDNIGKILLAVLSFQRLKQNHPTEYSGGILAIDELDCTLYPASQLCLLDALRRFSSDLNIQVIFTTHSLSILEKTCEWQSTSTLKDQVKVIHLQKSDNEIEIVQNPTYELLTEKLNVALAIKPKKKKINVFCEDEEAFLIAKALLVKLNANFNYMECKLGCGNLMQLRKSKIPCFMDNEALIILDGDIRKDTKKMKELRNYSNIIVLPGDERPESILARFLFELSDKSLVWNKIRQGYTKQLAFKTYTYSEIINSSGRKSAKDWFIEQKIYWGTGCKNLINCWKGESSGAVDEFTSQVESFLKRVM